MPVTNTRRMVTDGGLEWRSDSSGVTLEGHASTFNQPYSMGWYTETVARGAFTKTLAGKPDVRLLINHEGLPLARTNSAMVDKGTATLDLAQDDSGLYMRSVLDPSDPDVQRLVPKLRRGDLNEMSFAFGTVKDDWSPDRTERTLRELSLANGDVSVVTYPANPNATMSMRSKILESVGPERLREIYMEITEGRAGAKFSSATTSQLTALLESLAVADTHLDSSLVALSDLLGVANPDDDESPAEDADEGAEGGGRSADTETEEATIRAAREVRAARVRLELLRHQ